MVLFRKSTAGTTAIAVSNTCCRPAGGGAKVRSVVMADLSRYKREFPVAAARSLSISASLGPLSQRSRRLAEEHLDQWSTSAPRSSGVTTASPPATLPGTIRNTDRRRCRRGGDRSLGVLGAVFACDLLGLPAAAEDRALRYGFPHRPLRVAGSGTGGSQARRGPVTRRYTHRGRRLDRPHRRADRGSQHEPRAVRNHRG